MKTAVITGVSSGIGLEVSKTFLSAGWNVHGIDRVECPLSDIHFLQCDLSDRLQTLKAASRLRERLDGLDLLVNNAGQMERTHPTELSLERWDSILHSNLTAPFLLSRELVEHLAARQGSIVNIASTRAHMSEPNTESYSASKGGLVALTHALALSFGPRVRVNSISPGWIDVSDEKPTESDHAQHPAGRVGRPDDVARLVAFLADEHNSFITGADFVLDGGMTRKMIYE